MFVGTIAFAIRTGSTADEVYEHAVKMREIGPTVERCLREAARNPPAEYERQQGWVLIALQSAFYQLLHAANLERGVVDTVGRGGDTDTNAAIAGALLGAVWRRFLRNG